MSDDIAEEWETMGDDDSDEVGSERVLSQYEINRLLGFDSGNSSSNTYNPKHIKNGKIVEFVKKLMHVIEVDAFDYDVLEMSQEHYSEEYRNFRYSDVEMVGVDDIMKHPMIIFASNSLVYRTVDTTFGGSRSTSAMRIEGRPFTEIERHYTYKMLEGVIDNCNELLHTSFKLKPSSYGTILDDKKQNVIVMQLKTEFGDLFLAFSSIQLHSLLRL